MRQRLLNIANVSGLKVHGASAASGSENGHSSSTAHVVLPFVGIGMPMQFPYPSRMDGHYGRGNRRGHFELARINNPHLASLGALRNRLLGSSKSEFLGRHAERARSHFLICSQRARNSRLENKLFLSRHFFHRLFTYAEVFREHIVGSVRHPVGEQHRFVFREVAIVEYQQKLTAVRSQSLNGMRNSRGKVPEITFRYVGDETFAVQINRRNPSVSVEHDRPLSSCVPVQFANAAGSQSHIHASNRLGNRKLADRNLARPSTFLHPLVRKRERVLERLHAAGVRGRRQEGIRILGIQRRITWPGSAGATIVLCWIWFLLLARSAC